MTPRPLEPDRAAMTQMGSLVLDRVIDRIEGLPQRPATSILGRREAGDLVASLLTPPPAHGGDLAALLARLDEAADHALETAGPGHLADIPGSGLYTAAIAELYNRATNRYAGLTGPAPGFAALEESVVRWIATDVCGLPEGSGGLLTSGGSIATFSATVAARHHRLGEDFADGTVYTTAFAHHSGPATPRPVDSDLPGAARRRLPRRRGSGRQRRPATAGPHQRTPQDRAVKHERQ